MWARTTGPRGKKGRRGRKYEKVTNAKSYAKVRKHIKRKRSREEAKGENDVARSVRGVSLGKLT